MKISFLGTRGNIITKNNLHKKHTVTVVTFQKTRVAIDCGQDWLNKINEINVDAFVITHAHTDHINGLKNGAPCPIYATEESWYYLNNFPLYDKVIIKPRVKFSIGSLLLEAFFVEHSLRAPAVGYRITGGKTTIFCVHDLLFLKDYKQALKNVALYIGDGAIFKRPIIRYTHGIPVGHTTIKEQLTWCKTTHVPRAIFTHCGSHIVKDSTNTVKQTIVEYGTQQGIKTEIAYDGMKITL